jgi:hypothetical protein
MIGLLTISIILAGCGKINDKTTNQDTLLQTNISSEWTISNISLSDLLISVPTGICTMEEWIYICDSGNNCVNKYNEKWELLETYGTLGMEEGNFSKPNEIIYKNGHFYVLDSGNNRIQQFDKSFQYENQYRLDILNAEAGFGKYMDIDVNDSGDMFVSVFSTDIEDTYLYKISGNEITKLGEKIIGYMCNVEDDIYLSNMLEMKEAEETTVVESGKNYMYTVVKNSLKKKFELPEKYVPVALNYYVDRFYMICAATGCVETFAMDGKLISRIAQLPAIDIDMHMAISSSDKIYITDSANKSVYFISK